MKKNFFIALFLILFLSIPNVSAEVNQYKVLRVIDGDTFYIDFNNNGVADANERVRVNGIDAFEISKSINADWQIKSYDLTSNEVLGLGYLGKEFAKKRLLNKYVAVEKCVVRSEDRHGRPLDSIYYDCDKNGICKSYGQEILKAGLATVYEFSNLAGKLKPYENFEKIRKNAKKTHGLNLVVLNLKNGNYHKTSCEYGWQATRKELIKKPILKYQKARCCYGQKYKPIKYKPYNKVVKADAEEGNIKLFFLNPLKQKSPQNTCSSNACKALLYNIDNAKESIDFAIYGIAEQDHVMEAIVQAQKRGVKVRWVTDLTEKKSNMYPDTYKLMKRIPAYTTDFDSAESRNIPDYKYKLSFQGALMHDKFFIFDNKRVFTGSTNISSTCLTGYNSNVAVLIESPELAHVYTQEFEQMFDGKFHNEKSRVSNNENINISDMNVSVYFSPINKAMTYKIIPLIRGAKKYIYIPAYYLTRQDFISELAVASRRGVDIKIIVDGSGVDAKFTRIEEMKNNGLDVRVEDWNGKMHMKSLIIDDETLVIGSMNFTKQGESMNDENCLIIKNAPTLTAAYKAHFLKLWNSL